MIVKKGAFKASAYGISQAAKNAYVEMMYAGGEGKDILYTYTNGTEASVPEGYTLNYEGTKPKNGQVSLTKEGKVSLALHDGKYCVTKGYNDAEITIEEKVWDDCDMPGALLVDQSGANAPVLVQGMTPVIWNGTAWVSASNTDDPYKQNWYDYDSQKWANARTNDGSMWVWVPRYVYKISSGWHTNTTGTINIQFSQGTNDNWNSAVVGVLDTGTSASASNATTNGDKYTTHPAFTFGTTELTGVWVAKFEATASEGVYNGCQNTYETVGGVKASTTGNIYGVYDLNGGSWERVAAYYNNSYADDYGASIVNANTKYKDIYTVTTDNQATNYSNSSNKKGEALFETSNGEIGNVAWFGDYVSTPYAGNPWIFRGADSLSGSSAGVYSFHGAPGSDFSSHSFRPVLAIGTGL